MSQLLTAGAAGGGSTPNISFAAYLSNSQSNITGNGNFYIMAPDTVEFNNGGCYDAGSGLFTPTVTGAYAIFCSVYLTDLVAANNNINASLETGGADYQVILSSNPYLLAISGGAFFGNSIFVNLFAGVPYGISLAAYGNTSDNITLVGAPTPFLTCFGGYLVHTL